LRFDPLQRCRRLDGFRFGPLQRCRRLDGLRFNPFQRCGRLDGSRFGPPQDCGRRRGKMLEPTHARRGKAQASCDRMTSASHSGKGLGLRVFCFVDRPFVLEEEQLHLCKSTPEEGRVAHHDLLAVEGCSRAKCAPLLRRHDLLARRFCYCTRGCVGGVVISGAARRMERSPLPAFGHPPPQAGEGRFIA
jgi:hypothetical protein